MLTRRPSAMSRIMRMLFLTIGTVGVALSAKGQNVSGDTLKVVYPDSTVHEAQPLGAYSDETEYDSIDTYNSLLTSGKTPLEMKRERKRPKRDWSKWRPDAKKALWLAIVIPGGGQIYNRKYWKLPIFYGGFVGCIYALTWNNQMYHDYAQAYIDIMDSNPETHSYDKFMHLGNTINESNRQRYQELFRKRKDRYRRWRDLAGFVTVAVYALSVIDAYVDASLSDFDISNDLSLHVAPTVINTGEKSVNPIRSSAVGIGASLTF